MRNRLALILALGLSLSACKKKPTDTDLGPSMGPTTSAPMPATTEAAVQTLRENFERVHFAYDSANITSDSRQALSENAAILQRHPTVTIEIQGHADERGTTGYNLALGQRRAAVVQKQLTSMGVPASRLKTVSFGEERPLASGEGEVAWAANRRAEFRITTGDVPEVLGTIQ